MSLEGYWVERRAVAVDRPIGLIERLRRIRIEKCLAQEALGRKVGVTRNAITNWECGHLQPTFGNLRAWANALGYEVTLEKL